MFLDVDGTTKGRLELDFPHHGGILATGVRLLCARLEELVRMAIGTKRKREPTSLNNHNTCQYVSCPEIHRVTSPPESPSQSRISAFGNPYVQCSKQGHQKQASFAVCIVFNFNFFLLLLNLSPKKNKTFRPFSPLYVVIHKTVFDSFKIKNYLENACTPLMKLPPCSQHECSLQPRASTRTVQKHKVGENGMQCSAA